MTAGQNPSVDRGETVIRQQVIKARIPEQPVGLAVELRAEEKITRLREFDSLAAVVSLPGGQCDVIGKIGDE